MKLSIIITSYNSAKYLKFSINSVLKQTYKNFELIIVDDGSNDRSRKIINYYRNFDKRIKTLFLKKNSGTAAFPRNEGVKLSKGDYICFLDADDIWEKNKLEEQIKNINKKTIISFTSCKYISENGNKYSSSLQDFIRQYLQKIFIKKGIKGLYAYNPIILSSVLIKKKEFKKYYFDTSQSIVGVEDLDLWLKILFNIKKDNILFCNQMLVKIRRTTNSLNINYTQASLRNTYCVMKFFLEKKLIKDFQFFLIGMILRISKNLIKVSEKIIKKNISRAITIFLFFYFLFFYSPFFWYLGNKLIYYDKPNLTKNLIILSGNGNANYINISYQRRYLDTKDLLKNHNFDKIFLMGREQELEENEIIRSLLIYDGIKKENIFLIDKTFGNTKENISHLQYTLAKEGITEANFLTSPYHTMRSKLLWNKYKEDTDIYITNNLNSPKNNIRWKYEFNEMKVIIYEHLSLLYNRIRGWL